MSRSHRLMQLTRRWLLALSCAAGASGLLLAPAAQAADPNKVLRYVFITGETGFDPAISRDLYSAHVIQSVFETLYTYDYLARPSKVIPLTADGLPTITDGGKTYTIKLKKGIMFMPDAAFDGKKRELTMADYVYSWKRLMDPAVNSPHSWLFDGKLVGLDAAVAAAKKAGKFDHDAPIEGIELVDKYTLRLRFVNPDFSFAQILAHEPTSAVAKEVIEKYKDKMNQAMSNPVGTGPYKLTSWTRGSKMVLEANPDYRGSTWDFKAGTDPEDAKIVAALKGKKMPAIGKIEIYVMLEDQSRWLAFQDGQIDLFQLEGALAPKALDNGKLKPELAAKGVQLSRIVDPELYYVYWNMQDPVVGGLAPEKIALRRAIAMAHNTADEIKVVWNGEAQAQHYPIPPGVVGHNPNFKSTVKFDPAGANALLDKFGYKKGADGYRTLPDGKPLNIRFTIRNDGTGKQQSEAWRKTYQSLGIRMDDEAAPLSDMLSRERKCQLQSRNAPWIADYPDGDNFMQLFYGPNTGLNNNGCTKIPEYDKLYAKSQTLPPGPERQKLYDEMARILEVYAPIKIGFARYRNMLATSNVVGFKKHPILHAEWMHIDMKTGR